MTDDLALANAIAIVEMEGLYLSDDGYKLCQLYSRGEISWDDFLKESLKLIDR